MDRYRITKGSYNLFSRSISLNRLNDLPTFLHEYCHQFHNSSTIISGERFNLLIQILSHISRLTNQEKVMVPLNKWYEKIKDNTQAEEKLFSTLQNIWEHQATWLYLDKHNYSPLEIKAFSNNEIISDKLGAKLEPEFDSQTPYLFSEIGNVKYGFPIGGFQLMESAAFALELIHKEVIEEDVIEKYLKSGHFEYVIILEYVANYVQDIKKASLFTFLLCDLSMCLSMPSIGFLILALEVPSFLESNPSVIDYLKWYKSKFNEFYEDIKNGFSLELEMINSTKKDLLGLDEYLDLIFNYEIMLLEFGLNNLDVDSRLEYITGLLKTKSIEETKELIKLYPLTIIEDSNSIYFETLDQKTIYDLLNAVNKIYLGLCKDFQIILMDQSIFKHFEQINDNHYRINIATEEGETDEYGYWLNLLGLNNTEIIDIAGKKKKIKFVKQ